ncbi:TetR/AcrR family transcriptional regulator [Actinomadura rugatobispora]|uniref:TetR/AcrR family transcriptional regulator n=1 Tax=Actinomadura rugatobispora TaxID=1994 RepID=A0ABW1A8V9_9ACTN
MTYQLPGSAPVKDRRVRRSRAALMRATIDLVTERGTAAVPISDLAEAADVSRQVVYQQFGDRDTLLLETALDLGRRELVPSVTGIADTTGRGQVLALARHFAGHRAFYRVIFTGACGYGINKALGALLIPYNREALGQLYGERLDPRTIEDLAVFLVGGASVLVNAWVVEGEDPLDPEEFTDRLIRMVALVVDMQYAPVTSAGDGERAVGDP